MKKEKVVILAKREKRKEKPISIFDLIISVYKNDNIWGIRIFHKPSGIEIFENSCGSISHNRIAAMRTLQTKLWKLINEKEKRL